MACDCIAKMDAKLGEHNSRLCLAFVYGGPEGAQQRVSIRSEKIEPRNRKVMGAVATFCPFCGVPYASAKTEG
jgi:hypothetical protein